MIMGILNVTPDSFSDGGLHHEPGTALERARRMIAEGADIVDVGGESTRPGAEPVPEAEEIERVQPVVEALRSEWDGLISIDTMKPGVAHAALEVGADIVNDVAGLRDPGMIEVCARSGCGVVAMHMRGEPRTMQQAPEYEDVVTEVRSFFEERLATLTSAGIDPESLCFDPGIGFGKTLDHNLTLLRELSALQVGGRPLLIGVSRKSFIGRVLESDALEDREWPTVALTAWTRESGARIHRVHEVRPNREALRMVEAVLGSPV
ncbi:dihydropteroate synthase [Haloferula sp. A504]|uniref:dihydropteroate synthase n=1 Tax=Haloferula sp. A504 TaxID=3373601 RepID=UPI0031CC0BF1|nr:dihydropteroate synthase [Verrucomicrobiaceae bacterium E54]